MKYQDNHGFRFDGELREVPVTLRLLAEWNRSINIVSAYTNALPDGEPRRHLQTVLGMACDFLCNICYENQVDPFVLDDWGGESGNVTVSETGKQKI